MTAFYVYVAPPNQVATIHKSECPHCRAGRGQTGAPKKPTTTKWSESHPTKEAALRYAKASGMKSISQKTATPYLITNRSRGLSCLGKASPFPSRRFPTEELGLRTQPRVTIHAWIKTQASELIAVMAQA
jgi:hypothetical protein